MSQSSDLSSIMSNKNQEDYLKKNVEPEYHMSSAVYGDKISSQSQQASNDYLLSSNESKQKSANSKQGFPDEQEIHLKMEENEKSKQKSVLSLLNQFDLNPAQQKQIHNGVYSSKLDKQGAQIKDQGEKHEEKVENKQLLQINFQAKEEQLQQNPEQSNEIKIQENQGQNVSLQLKEVQRPTADISQPVLSFITQSNQALNTIQLNIQQQQAFFMQFREEISMKLQNNLRQTLQEKFNQMNRQNNKEIMSIKNIVQQLADSLMKNENRLQKIQNLLEQINKKLN